MNESIYIYQKQKYIRKLHNEMKLYQKLIAQTVPSFFLRLLYKVRRPSGYMSNYTQFYILKACT